MTNSRKSFKLIVVGAFTALCASCMDIPEPPPFKIVSSSPQQSYAVTIERKQRKPTKEDWTSWKIYLSYASQAQQVLNEVEVASGDFSTGPHYRKDPRLNWVYENTFRLDDSASSAESESDVLFVRNDSASALSYLVVSGDTGEWFYILNLASRASMKLYARPQWRRADSSWIEASGQFTSGGRVSAGQNFRFPPFIKGPGRYCINVKDDGIMLTSLDFEGSKLAEFTPEQERQLEESRKKREAGQATEADEKTRRETDLNRAEIITPRSADCGGAKSVSSRP